MEQQFGKHESSERSSPFPITWSDFKKPFSGFLRWHVFRDYLPYYDFDSAFRSLNQTLTPGTVIPLTISRPIPKDHPLKISWSQRQRIPTSISQIPASGLIRPVSNIIERRIELGFIKRHFGETARSLSLLSEALKFLEGKGAVVELQKDPDSQRFALKGISLKQDN